MLGLGGDPIAAQTPSEGAATTTGSTYSWTQFGGGAEHTLNNTSETTINIANVASLQQLFEVTLTRPADSAPIYLSNVKTATGTRNLLYVTDRGSDLLALDANTGAQVWAHAEASQTCDYTPTLRCHTTASPALDPSLKYVYAYLQDGYVHKYKANSGAEVTGGGWPELVTAKPVQEKVSGSLSIAIAANGTAYLYVGASTQDVQDDYQGHVTTINLTDGSQHVFNVLCSNQVDIHFVLSPGTPDCGSVTAGVWGRPTVLYVPALDRVFFGTGDGPYAESRYNWGNSVLALNPDGTSNGGIPLDSYTPTNYATLHANDTDIGSTTPVLLPVPAGSLYPDLALQIGKDGMLRLLNLDNLSGLGGPGNLGGEVAPVVPLYEGPAPTQPTEVIAQPAVWVNPEDNSTWVFINTANGITALQLDSSNGTPTLTTMWQNPCNCQGQNGNSPLVANGVLYIAYSGGLQALDPITGALLWTGAIGTIHWQSPIVDNGVLYVADQGGHLYAYSLPATTP